MDQALRLRAIQSTMDLERQIAARTAAQLAEARELIRIAALDLRDDERHATLAQRLAAHAKLPIVTTTGEAA
jgi:hypothetical protein